ncbi:hypothetical protein SNEBB_000334 [Seison nebaliae]|nr:hypothetical protein SNEBB_000334 [Seison nebaliae]
MSIEFLLQSERSNALLQHLYAQKDFKTAKRLIHDINDSTMNMSEQASRLEGLIAREEGNLHLSSELFQNCIIHNPQNTMTLKEVARNLSLQSSNTAAIDVFEQCESRTKSNEMLSLIHYYKAEAYFKCKKFDKCFQELDMALKANELEQAYMLWHKTLMQKESEMNAIAISNKLEGGGDMIEPIQQSKRKKTLKTSADSLSRGCAIFPESSPLFISLGIVYMQLKYYQKAFESLSRVLTFQNENLSAILALAVIMQQHGDYEVALSKYRTASRIIPESSNIWNNIGMCFYGKNKFVASIACLKQALYFSPLDWKIHYNLGLVHIHVKQYASAFNFLSAALSLQPKEIQIYPLLGITLFHLENKEQCMKCFDKGLALDKNNVELLYNKYVALIKMEMDGRNVLDELKDVILEKNRKKMKKDGDTQDFRILIENLKIDDSLTEKLYSIYL